ncbi:ABC transporter ATP-binding protein [Beijerinckia indica]|uniref:ABC transporter related n=1 Tax=Beijerinckia indica subsp. indica (strain ATCC 9039 / DSM 1715 / NCIMB 8712) TaxID=395963 RepID=B2II05_BEII9|nr:ABC transporter ATP-binding protein [Beijerinckia indica]ACB94588.1 ABC transporter related [Beijerinckia indica subsp. indica ATCC 9039]
MLNRLEDLLQPTEVAPEAAPPQSLIGFYWHFAKQVKGLVLILFATSFTVGLIDLALPFFLGRIVGMVDSTPREVFWPTHGRELLFILFVILVARPFVFFGHGLITNQVLTPGLTNLTRWQNHWHVVRQSWAFFQNDFAGRIASRVVQTGASLRETIVTSVDIVWRVLVYGASALFLLSAQSVILALPLAIWFVFFIALLRFFVPRMRDRSRANSDARSALTGRVVDSYTNILTVKLFARARDEDHFVRDAIDNHTKAFRAQQRLNTLFGLCLSCLNASLISGTGIVALNLWSRGALSAAMVATGLTLTWQVANLAWWISQSVTTIFEAVGAVQEGMRSVAVPRQMPDRPDAKKLHVTEGEIRFEHVTFGYGTTRGVLHDLNLTIRGGERIGLIGHSGAGKSTLVNLLLHFFDVESGRILIDGQDIAKVTQESLRARIAMVTQDTSLLHRSIRDNIRYGRLDASEAEIRAAAEQAHALDFIERLEDHQGRHGFEAQVGERGVKLSGGQRQRIAIARVILKNAPILILDEATSALDSEVEAAIQEQLGTLMQGRTVIAIAHRLSTIAQMDRLIVLDHGSIIEQGTHKELLAANGAYARAWKRQSGQFEAARSNKADAIFDLAEE